MADDEVDQKVGQQGVEAEQTAMVRLRVQRALHWTRLSCKRFVSNQVRLGLFVLAYNLGFFAVNPAVAQNDAKVTASDDRRYIAFPAPWVATRKRHIWRE